jgi:hypothetical protein
MSALPPLPNTIACDFSLVFPIQLLAARFFGEIDEKAGRL